MKMQTILWSLLAVILCLGCDQKVTPAHQESSNWATNFKTAIEYSQKATVIVNSGTPYGIIGAEVLDEIIEYQKKALGSARKVDIAQMNKYHAGFGDRFKNEYILGLELTLKGFEEDDAETATRGQLLLHNWGQWYVDNIQNNMRI